MGRRGNVDEETSSQRSGTSGGETASQSSHQSTLKHLRHDRPGVEHEEGDLLEQRRSLQDGVFSCMYTLVRQSAMNSWKFAVLKVVMEFLMFFIVAFNKTYPQWDIDEQMPVWAVLRWVIWREPILSHYGYHTYVIVLYVMVACVFVALAGLIWLTLAMRRTEKAKWLRQAALCLHVVYDVMFFICYVSFFDYFVYVANCDFLGPVKRHMQFKGVMCLEMPHLLHLCVGLFTAAMFLTITALMVVASSDLNPVSKGHMASPAVYTRLQVLLAKAVFVISAADLDAAYKWQAGINLAAVALICYWNYQALPFYRAPMNFVWCGEWLGILYTTVILQIVVFSPNQNRDFQHRMTMFVLYGIFPVVAGGMLLCVARWWWAMRPSSKFRHLDPGVKLVKVHRFSSKEEVGLLARVMRMFDEDGVVEPAAADLGETIIKAGMQAYPDAPSLFILYANFLLEVRKDGPGSRTQLQLAFRHSPSLIERYQIFCTGESSKRLKDSQDCGMDLQAYIEFRRNFRAVLRVHKEVLMLQNELWKHMLRATLRVTDVDRALDALEASTAMAQQVYKRVLERYPTNGKLLRCYGKFLEDVRHDPLAATRVYGEASRNGGGDAMLSLDLSRVQGSADKPEFLSSMSMEDDAVIVINAKGQVMMVSQAVQKVFGYPKAELEGSNVSVLMPQPFCQRHDSYIERYTSSGESHLLDTVREVIGLHKDRYVFPMALCVTRMSGVGEDSIFLGVARPLPPNSLTMRAWLAPNGVFMCGDQQFASLCGMLEGELVGRALASMLADPDALVNALLERCRAASVTELMAGTIQEQLLLKHRYMDPVPVAVTVGLAGTDSQRILVLNCTVRDHNERNILVVDPHMRIRFASCGLAGMLGFPARKLMAMRLDELLPPPFNALHMRYLKEPPNEVPPTSCRAGKVVHLVHESGSAVPVRLKISNAAGADGALNVHVVQITKATQDEVLEEKRLVVTATFGGRVLSVSQPESELFDFRAQDMVGRSLCDAIDIFREWRDRAGESQMQLLMLALLDKEHEMPGTSWRVRVHAPASEPVPNLPAIPGAKSMRGAANNAGSAAKAACLQVELHEAGVGDEARVGTDLLGIQSGSQDSSPGSSEVDNHIRVTLWRRDLLTGVVELDEELVVRRASPITGLITGMPATAMLKKPIQRFLDIPPNTTWDKLAEAHTRRKQRGGLKDDSKRGKISPPMAFIGPHPDTGTMRIIVQGVQVLAPGGRAKVTLTLHPDTTFAGAHADLMRVLHLDAALRADEGGGTAAAEAGAGQRPEKGIQQQQQQLEGQPAQHSEQQGQDSPAPQPDADREASGDGAAGAAAGQASCSRPANGGAEHKPGAALDGADGCKEESGSEEEGGASDGPSPRRKHKETAGKERDLEAEGQAKILGRAASKSEFVAQWVRTLTKRRSGSQRDIRPPSSGAAAGAAATSGEGAAQTLLALPAPSSSPPGTAEAGVRLKISGLPAIPEDSAPEGPQQESDCAIMHQKTGRTDDQGVSYDYADQKSTVAGSRQNSRALSTPPTRQRANETGMKGGAGGGAEPGGEAGGQDGGGAAGEKWEKASEGESSADGSQAASGISSATGGTSISELVIDTRRGRLLKGLQKLLLGPLLMRPLDRLRLHTYAMLAFMATCHIVCYVIVSSEIAAEDHDIYLVQRQALAMDRSQLITVRAMMGSFCERANVTAKVSVCANNMQYTLGKLKENTDLMELHHQFVYLGDDRSKTLKLMPEVFNLWTSPWIEYHSYLDTSPPHVLSGLSGVWQLGSNYIAAAREAQYWLPRLRDRYKLHRTFQFLVTNGLGPLFTAYAKSLDLLVDSAWKSVDGLRVTLVVLLVVEALVIQLSCLVYEGVLVQRLEGARLVGILAMLGLPAPVLRQLANRDVKGMLDAGDDDDDDDDSDTEEPQRKLAAGNPDEGAKQGGLADAQSAKLGNNGDAQKDGERLLDSAEGFGRVRPKAAKAIADSSVGGEDASDKRIGQLPSPVAGGAVAAARPGSGGRAAFKLPSDAPADDEDDSAGVLADGKEGDGLRRCRTEARIPRLDGRSSSGNAKGGATKGWLLRSHARVLHINGKVLVPSYSSITKFLMPFALWNCAMVIIYVVSLLELQGMQGPLASLNMASHIIYRYTRVRAIAFGFVSQDDAMSRSLWRDMLENELRLFESEYDALMYGGVPITQANAVFNHPVPASTFASSSFSNEFFRSKRCYRFDQSLCHPPGSEYHEVTHNGLDVMVRRMIAEMRLLSEDADEDVAYNGTRYTFMYAVGGRDLYEGLQQAAQLFVDYSISHYHQVATLHTILLISTLGLVVLYVIFILWPHLARLKNDAARQSALLSHVPPEVDVRGHVRAVAKRALHGKQRQSSQTGALVVTAGVGLPALKTTQ